MLAPETRINKTKRILKVFMLASIGMFVYSFCKHCAKAVPTRKGLPGSRTETICDSEELESVTLSSRVFAVRKRLVLTSGLTKIPRRKCQWIHAKLVEAHQFRFEQNQQNPKLRKSRKKMHQKKSYPKKSSAKKK